MRLRHEYEALAQSSVGILFAPKAISYGLLAALSTLDCDVYLLDASLATERVDEMHLDPLDGRVVEIVIAQAVGIGGEPFRKRAHGLRCSLPRQRGQHRRARGQMKRQAKKFTAGKFHDAPPGNRNVVAMRPQRMDFSPKLEAFAGRWHERRR